MINDSLGPHRWHSDLESTESRELAGGRRTAGWLTAAGVGLAVVANALALSDFRLPFLGPAIGFGFLIVMPACLLYMTRLWEGASGAERLGYSIAGILLVLMVGGLALNSLLPLVGVKRSLGTVPVVLLADAMNLALYVCQRIFPAASPPRMRPRTSRMQRRGLGPEESRLLAVSGLCVILGVLGANRLNNGAGNLVSLVALAGMVLALVLLLCWQPRVRDATTGVTIYMVSLGLLLMTSLRGWSVTGHDIQSEYRVFQLTEAHAHWSMAYFHSAYYGCLSITILPTEISQIVHVDNPYVYKVFFQMLFALCPVLVYSFARRYFSGRISSLAVLYFIGIPTFFTDMPFINRQEIAFLFVACAVLAVTNRQWSLSRRQLTFCAMSVGVEVSHYTSMYFFMCAILVAWLALLPGGLKLRLARGARHRTASAAGYWRSRTRTVGLGSVFVLLCVAFVWGDLVTHQSGTVLTDAKSAVVGLLNSTGTRSGDVSIIPFFGHHTLSLQTVLSDYRQNSFRQRALSPPSTYLAPSVVDRYSTPLANGLPSMPLTVAGKLLSHIGVSASEVNSVIRNGAAKDELLFALVGFAAVVLDRRLRRYVGREAFFIGLGCMAMLAALIVGPNLSVFYGVLRGFQEALIVIAPALVAGSLTAFSPFGRIWSLRIATVVCVGIFISTCGLLPEVLGGYPASLNLNNSGQYYNIYYMQPQEDAAVRWLESEPGVLSDGVQASAASSRFAFTARSKVTGSQTITEIYPSLVRRDSWVVVGYSTVHEDQSTIFYDGDLVTYKYPMAILNDNKNLVYNNGGTYIYK
jgi:uncharacterized membrane protein